MQNFSDVSRLILILKAKPTTAVGHETFLKNRDWQVFSTVQLEDALRVLLSYKPAFMLIPIDHPSKKIQALPKLISSQLPTTIIMYCEESTRSAEDKLMTSNLPNRIVPPMTGPAIERMINKILKAQQRTPAQLLKVNGDITPRTASEMTVVAGEKTASSGEVVQKGPSSLLKQLLQESTESVETDFPIEPGPVPKRTRMSADHVFAKGTMFALERLTSGADQPIVHALGQTSNVGCLTVEGSGYSGYLVCAMAADVPAEVRFIEQMHQRLLKFLKFEKHIVDLHSPAGLKLLPAAFTDWAPAAADFVHVTGHEGSEVAVAFFPSADTRVAIGTSSSAEMGSLKLDDLVEDVALEFDLYVHLPANQKYVLYTPKGALFYGSQKERLSEGGVKELFIKRTDLPELQKYRARNYLNSQIAGKKTGS